MTKYRIRYEAPILPNTRSQFWIDVWESRANGDAEWMNAGVDSFLGHIHFDLETWIRKLPFGSQWVSAARLLPNEWVEVNE